MRCSSLRNINKKIDYISTRLFALADLDYEGFFLLNLCQVRVTRIRSVMLVDFTIIFSS